jgi:hypothetical protein
MNGAYRCEFLDQDRKVSSFQDIGAANDSAATAAAKVLALAHQSPGFDLWRGLRLVHREG